MKNWKQWISLLCATITTLLAGFILIDSFVLFTYSTHFNLQQQQLQQDANEGQFKAKNHHSHKNDVRNILHSGEECAVSPNVQLKTFWCIPPPDGKWAFVPRESCGYRHEYLIIITRMKTGNVRSAECITVFQTSCFDRLIYDPDFGQNTSGN